MKQLQLTRDEVWTLVRDGYYIAYRVKLGKNWEWRLDASQSTETPLPLGHCKPQERNTAL
jgi:hypothetical protein